LGHWGTGKRPGTARHLPKQGISRNSQASEQDEISQSARGIPGAGKTIGAIGRVIHRPKVGPRGLSYATGEAKQG